MNTISRSRLIARSLPKIALSALTLLLATACGTDCDVGYALDVAFPSTAVAGTTVKVSPQGLVPSGGCEAAAVNKDSVEVEVSFGGGSAPKTATPGESFDWKLGLAPIRQSLRLTSPKATKPLVATLIAESAPAIDALPFAKINAWMEAEKIKGSTEDLALNPQGDAWVMGVPGALIEVKADGSIQRKKTTGDALLSPLGLAFDRQGHLWIADVKAATLVEVDSNGLTKTRLKEDLGAPLQGPNYVAIDRQDRVLLTDPCLGRLMRFDHKSDQVDARASFDLMTEGGPNGVALDPQGAYLYVVTENIALTCPEASPKPDPQASIAGLFRLPLTTEGFGPRETVQTGLAVFGDGMAFDNEGNLYVIIDTVENFALKASRISVLRKGEQTLVPFISATDHIFANVAFGRGAFGATTLYTALLAVPPFVKNEKRGLMKLDIGVKGLPLL